MPLQATSGAASYDAFGGGAAAVPQYIEDVFSTYVYTGNASTQIINNGIDLSTYGGLVWGKSRVNAYYHNLTDSARGTSKYLVSNDDGSEGTSSSYISSFNNNGYTLGPNGDANQAGNNVGWTFRKQAKFFDVVTYTGTGSNTTIAHNLGSVPGCIIIKQLNATRDWAVYHRSLANTEYLVLNSTAAKATGATWWNSTTPTSSVFSIGTSSSVNASGGTYVAYLFAHDAGGFGLTGTDNVISCGSFTTDGSGNATVNLGYEPQWLLLKSTVGSANWRLFDSMRGMSLSSSIELRPNTSGAEANQGILCPPNATGFNIENIAGVDTFIYIAIRRGPMKVPTVGTSVFSPVTYTGNATARSISGLGFPPDLVFPKIRDNGGGFNGTMTDRLRGATNYVIPNDTSAETTNANYVTVLGQDGFSLGTGADVNRNTSTFISWNFRRAPSYFDEVCYTGTGSTTTITHNLGVTPELVITKSRTNGALGWVVWTTSLTSTNYWIRLDDTMAQTNSPVGYGGTFSASNYTIANTGPYNALNGSGQTYVAYLFATCAGVSKVGSYTGNGSSQTINCGFTGGARFVLIKRTDSTGDWMVSDSARGIVSGNDPYLELNNTNAEVTGEDWLDTDSTGFVVNEVSGSNANTSSATYIFLAIA